ncbi:MAG: class I SAM-dependent methyltransferase [Methanobrevibacter sp.]|uniref:class I SAM-dependent methyltransferase n=1 Tax=Methanobrevibacter sp. TaxID=66852 RepID=UPI001B5B08C7|nr:class I SAM-dependent methyltransferase [Methanobrevibacter sp.]MBP3790403.1 class I SAM-dependent methyltransferase [Methanobrevibacter sp.]
MSRLYGENKDIDPDEVKNFFADRANRELESDLSIVLFQDKENSEQRHIEEKKLLLEHIDVSDKKVLEVGCGIGRWVEALHDKCESFLGIDYTEDLIDIANETYDYDNCKFQLMSATDIKADELLIEPPFDLIIFSGVLMYINDEDIKLVFEELNKVGAEDKKLFIMEPISHMGERLTLKDFYSEGLEADYSAIYRTEDEYMELFKYLNPNEVFSDDLFEDLSDHSETHYKYFIIE